MSKPSAFRSKSMSVMLSFDLPVLDDAAAVLIYNLLCDLVDRFDHHYGEQICRFYATQDKTRRGQPMTNPDE
jgi:hypothetical protein